MIKAMHNLTVRVFGHMEIKSSLDLDIRIKYTDSILNSKALKNTYRSCWSSRRRLRVIVGTNGLSGQK